MGTRRLAAVSLAPFARFARPAGLSAAAVAAAVAQMVHKEGAGVYGEVESLVTLLGFATANAGCCKVALHPRWGSAFYPASLLTKAPLDATTKALADAAAALAATLAA